MPTRDDIIRADWIEAEAFIDLYAAVPAEIAQRLRPQTSVAAGATTFIVPGLPSPLFNRVLGLGLESPATSADLEAALERFQSAGVPGWWLHWSPEATPRDFPEVLEKRGFTPPGRRSWAKMLRDASPPPEAGTDLVIVAANGARAVAATRCIVDAFGMPAVMEAWLAGLHDRARWRVYAALDGDQVVGGACLFIEGDTGWLGMGGILASHRRRGGQLALMSRRIADALDAGCRYVATETGEPMGDEPNPSLANMYRAGFERVASRLNFQAPALTGNS
jgi:GNAT superfamily N-acetyltransferase